MTSNEITTITNAPAKFTFKSKELNTISTEISKATSIINSAFLSAQEAAESFNKTVAPLLGRVMTTECYKEDGFKNVAEYAESTFGGYLKRSWAYALARVGRDFYLVDTPETRKARETLSTARLAEMTGTKPVEIAAAIDSGELKKDATLADCRTFATSHKPAGKEKVVPTFNVFTMNGKTSVVENIDKSSMYAEVAQFVTSSGNAQTLEEVQFSAVKLPGDKPSAAQHFIAYTVSGYTCMFEFRPYVTPKAKSKSKREKFDLVAYIASLSPEERASLAQMVSAQNEDEGEGGDE